MEFLKKLVTARAALIAFVVALLVAARSFGFIIPQGADDSVSKLIDTGLIFLGMLLTGSALHNADPPEVAKAKKLALKSSQVISVIFLCAVAGLLPAALCTSPTPWQDVCAELAKGDEASTEQKDT